MSTEKYDEMGGVITGNLVWPDVPFSGNPIFIPVDFIEFEKSKGVKNVGCYVIKNRNDGETLYPVKK